VAKSDKDLIFLADKYFSEILNEDQRQQLIKKNEKKDYEAFERGTVHQQEGRGERGGRGDKGGRGGNMNRKPREELKEVTPEEAGLAGFGTGNERPRFVRQVIKKEVEEVKTEEPVQEVKEEPKREEIH
jgi:ribosomal protein L15